jgi:hypothetical protein
MLRTRSRQSRWLSPAWYSEIFEIFIKSWTACRRRVRDRASPRDGRRDFRPWKRHMLHCRDMTIDGRRAGLLPLRSAPGIAVSCAGQVRHVFAVVYAADCKPVALGTRSRHSGVCMPLTVESVIAQAVGTPPSA